MICKGGRCYLFSWQVEIRQNPDFFCPDPHPWVVFIIPTGCQVSAVQHNRKPGTSCDPEEYFLSVFRMPGAHEGNHANISSWFAVWLWGVCQHPAKWQSFHVALRATKNQYFNCIKSSMTQLCCVTLCVSKAPTGCSKFWGWFFPGLFPHLFWAPVVSSQKWDLMACLPSNLCCFTRRNCRGFHLLNMQKFPGWSVKITKQKQHPKDQMLSVLEDLKPEGTV